MAAIETLARGDVAETLGCAVLVARAAGDTAVRCKVAVGFHWAGAGCRQVDAPAFAAHLARRALAARTAARCSSSGPRRCAAARRWVTAAAPRGRHAAALSIHPTRRARAGAAHRSAPASRAGAAHGVLRVSVPPAGVPVASEEERDCRAACRRGEAWVPHSCCSHLSSHASSRSLVTQGDTTA